MLESMTERLKGKRVILSVVVMTLLVVTFFAVRANKLNKVLLSVDGVEKTVYHKEMTVGNLLEEEKIELSANMFISEPTYSEITDGMTIIVRYPNEYTIKLGDLSYKTVSFAKNVSAIVADAGFILDEDDYTIPPTSEEVSDNSVIEVYKVGKVEEIVKEPVSYQIVNRENPKLEKGKTVVAQEGEDGVKAITYSVTLVNGVRKEKSVVSEVFEKEPVNEVVEKGTKPIVVASRSASTKAKDTTKRIDNIPGADKVGANGFLSDGTAYSNVIVMSSTVYNNSPEQNGGWTTTASGTPLRRGVVAVDPKLIPLGTRVYVESLDGSADYGYAIAEDTGGSIKGKKIDLCVGDGSTKGYGRRNVRVYILD